MTYLALDQSKSCTGWAHWEPGTDAPRYGHWVLGSEYTSRGAVYAKLHRCLSDHHKVLGFDRLYFEEPITPGQLQGGTTIQTISLLMGIASHIESFGAIRRCRMVKEVNVTSWRTDFLGRDAHQSIKRAAKAAQRSARDPLKAATMERCRQLGFAPKKNDEADALGILTYSILLDGVTPPWLANETLRAPLTGAAA